MKDLNQEELNEILEKHEMWLRGEEGGERADLINVDLRGVNLSYTNLSGADLRNANLSGVDLTYIDLSNADLWNTNLSYTELKGSNLWNINLSESDLNNADLSYTNLRGANLSYTNLSYTDLRGADLRYANLNNADLRYAILNNIETNINTIGYNLACPEEGSFIGYKKSNGCIVKLLILEDSKRSSATTFKCRCDKAKVLDITEIATGEKLKNVSSNYDGDFIYRVGEIITVEDFDDDRWNECSTGIHLFVNKENALNY